MQSPVWLITSQLFFLRTVIFRSNLSNVSRHITHKSRSGFESFRKRSTNLNWFQTSSRIHLWQLFSPLQMSDAEQFVFSSRNADRTQEWIMTGGGSEKKLSGKGGFLSENIMIFCQVLKVRTKALSSLWFRSVKKHLK